MRTTSTSSLAPGVVLALTSAALFGASTPLSKLLVGHLDPVLLAGLLYFGSGVGLALWWGARRFLQPNQRAEAGLRRADLPWLAGATLAGGIVGPLLLMVGLSATPASSASLLLNLESVLTALLAWFVFKENVDRRVALGMAAISAGSVLLSWPDEGVFSIPWGSLAIVGACLAWATDNNLTRKVSAGDPVQIAAVKGLVAGTFNLGIAFGLGAAAPGLLLVAGAALVGLLGYGVSLVLFIVALRNLGTARTGAYFSSSPFVGAALSILLLGDRPTVGFLAAASLMALGVWLHLTERHEHEHDHEPLEHDHRHIHDGHHQHVHAASDPPGEPHAHRHFHPAVRHAHPHYPDIHHRHDH